MFTAVDIADAFEFLLTSKRTIGIDATGRNLEHDVRSYLANRGRARFKISMAEDIAEFEALLDTKPVQKEVKARGLALWSMKNAGWRPCGERVHFAAWDGIRPDLPVLPNQ